MESHTFGLRKGGRKLPPFDPYGQCSKNEKEKCQEKNEMKRKTKRNEKEQKRKAKGRNKNKGKEFVGERKGNRKRRKRVQEKNKRCTGLDFVLFLEREHLLSRISVDRTVGFLRTKKQSGSTHRGLHEGTGFGSFRHNL